jgi:hypothetical protein
VILKSWSETFKRADSQSSIFADGEFLVDEVLV